MGVCVTKPVVVLCEPALQQESLPSQHEGQAIDERIPEGFNPEKVASSGERGCQKIVAKISNACQSPFQGFESWQESGFLSVIENHVFSVPSSNAKTTGKLARSLTNISSNMQELNHVPMEIVKAYVIYFWIINNIKYNMNMLPSANSCSATLAKRSGTADEVASLFDSLCTEAGLKSQKVKGNLKSWRSVMGHSFQLNQQNCHSWNMVTVGKQPILVDCVLGSGYVNSSSCFVTAPSNCYFAVPPHYLILTHWPTNPSEQFLRVPLSFDEMQAIIPVSMRVINCGLHPQSWCEVIPLGQDSLDPVVSVSVQLKSPTTYLTAKLVLDSAESEFFSCGELQAKTLIKSTSNDEYSIEAVVPTSGVLSLYIYLHSIERDHSRLDNFCLCYTIKADLETRLNVGYPFLYSLPAKVFGFSPLYWNIGKKSYEAVHTNDVLSIVGEVKSDLLFDHCIVKGLVTSSSEAETHHRYDYNTLLRQNRDKNLWKLFAVFPNEGWWTVCISATKNGNDEVAIGYTALLYYHVSVSNGRPELSFPQLFLQDIVFDSKPVMAAEDVTTVGFTSSSFHANSNHYLTYQQPSGELWDGLTSIETHQSGHYRLSAVFPKVGIWYIHVFSEAITESVGMFRLKLLVKQPIPNTFLVQTNLEQQNYITYVDGRAIKFLDDGRPLSFRFIWCGPDVTFLPSLKSQDGSVARHCTFLEQKVDDSSQSVHTLHVLFPYPGKWTVELFSSSNWIFGIKLTVKNSVSGYMYPEMFPEFNKIGCEVSLADAQIKPRYDDDFRLSFRGPPDVYFFSQVDSQLWSKDLSQQSFVHSCPNTREKTLLFIFPARGEWVVTLYAKAGDDDCCLLRVSVSNTTFKSDLSFPLTLENFYQPFELYFNLDDLPLQSVVQVGAHPEIFRIQFYSPREDVVFEHYAEVQSRGRRTSTDSVKSYKRVLTRIISNRDTHAYELQVEVAKPGKWTVFLHAKRDDDEAGLGVMQYAFSARRMARIGDN